MCACFDSTSCVARTVVCEMSDKKVGDSSASGQGETNVGRGGITCAPVVKRSSTAGRSASTLPSLLSSSPAPQEDAADAVVALKTPVKVVVKRGPVVRPEPESGRPSLQASSVAGSLLGLSVNQQAAARAGGLAFMGHDWHQFHDACRSWLSVIPRNSAPLVGSFAGRPMEQRGGAKNEAPVRIFVKDVLKRLCNKEQGEAFAARHFQATKEKGIAPRQIVGENAELAGVVSPLLRGKPIPVIPPSEAGPLFNGFRNTQAICSGASPVLAISLEWEEKWEQLVKDPSTGKTVKTTHPGQMMKILRWVFADGDCWITDKKDTKTKGEMYLFDSTGGCYFTPGMLKPGSGVGDSTFVTSVHMLVGHKDVHHVPLHGPLDNESHENKTIDGHPFNPGYSAVLYDAQALDQFLLRAVGVTGVSRTVITLFVQQVVVLAPMFKRVYPSEEELDRFAELPGQQSRSFTAEKRFCSYRVKEMNTGPFREVLQLAAKTVAEGLRTPEGTAQLQSGVPKDGDKTPQTLLRSADDLLQDLVHLTMYITRKETLQDKFDGLYRFMSSAAKVRRQEVCDAVESEVLDSLPDPPTADQLAKITEAKECIVRQFHLPRYLQPLLKTYSARARVPAEKGEDGEDEEDDDNGSDGGDCDDDAATDDERVEVDGDYKEPVEEPEAEEESESEGEDEPEGEEESESEDSESESDTSHSSASSDSDASESDPRVRFRNIKASTEVFRLDDQSSSDEDEESDEEESSSDEDEDSSEEYLSADEDFVAHENVTENLKGFRVRTRAQQKASEKDQPRAETTRAVEGGSGSPMDVGGGCAQPAKVHSEVAQLQKASIHDDKPEEKVPEDTRTYNDKLHAQVALSAQATHDQETKKFKGYRVDAEAWEAVCGSLNEEDRERFLEVTAGDLASAFSLSIAINAGNVKVAGGGSVKIPIYTQYVCYLTCKQENFVTDEVSAYKAALDSYDDTRLEAFKEEDRGVVRTTHFMSIALQLVLPVLAELDEKVDEVNAQRKLEAKAKGKVGDKRKRAKSPTESEPISYPFFQSFCDSVRGMTKEDESSKLVRQLAGRGEELVPPGVVPIFVWTVCKQQVGEWDSRPREEAAGAGPSGGSAGSEA